MNWTATLGWPLLLLGICQMSPFLRHRYSCKISTILVFFLQFFSHIDNRAFVHLSSILIVWVMIATFKTRLQWNIVCDVETHGEVRVAFLCFVGIGASSNQPSRPASSYRVLFRLPKNCPQFCIVTPKYIGSRVLDMLLFSPSWKLPREFSTKKMSGKKMTLSKPTYSPEVPGFPRIQFVIAAVLKISYFQEQRLKFR